MQSRGDYWRRRATAQASLLLAIGAVIFVTSSCFTLILGFTSREPTQAARAALHDVPVSDASLVWTVDGAGQSPARSKSEEARLRRAFEEAPVIIRRIEVGDALPISRHGTSVVPIQDSAEIRSATTGLTPPGLGEISIDSTGAKTLGVGVGDHLILLTDAGDRSLVIVSIWQPDNPQQAIWNGLGPNVDGSQARVVLSSSEMNVDEIDLFERWTIAPNLTTIRAEQLPQLISGYEALEKAASSTTSFVRVEGRAASSASRVHEALTAASAASPSGLILVTASGGLALVVILNMLAGLRSREAELLSTRGASMSQVAGADTREYLVVALVAGPLGSIVAQLALLKVGPPGSVAEVFMGVLIPSVVALMVGTLQAIRLPRRNSKYPSGRSDSDAFAVTLVAVVLSTVALLRLAALGFGSDASTAAAPGLAVLVLCAVGISLARPSTWAASKYVQRSEDHVLFVSVRRVQFRRGLLAGATLLIAIATATNLYALTAVSTTVEYLQGTGRLVNGGDLQLTTSEATGKSLSSHAITDVLQGDKVAHAFVDEIQLGDLSATLAAAPAHTLNALEKSAGLAGLMPTGILENPPPGASLSGGDQLTVTVDSVAAVSPPGSTINLTGWIVSSQGQVRAIDIGPAAIGLARSRIELKASLPSSGDWTLVAFDATAQSSGEIDDLDIRLENPVLSGVGPRREIALPAESWDLTSALERSTDVTATDGIGWRAPKLVPTAEGKSELGRLMPSGPVTVPIAISQGLADASGLRVDDEASFQGDVNLFSRVVAIVPRIPGTESTESACVDLVSLQIATLRSGAYRIEPNRLWISTLKPDRLAAQAVTVDPSVGAVVAPGVQLVQLGMSALFSTIVASIAVALFSLLGTAGAVLMLRNRRREDVRALYALGATERFQRGAAAIELGASVIFATLVGLAAAAVAAAITLPTIARSFFPYGEAADHVPLQLNPISLGILALSIIGAGCVALWTNDRVLSRAVSRARKYWRSS